VLVGLWFPGCRIHIPDFEHHGGVESPCDSAILRHPKEHICCGRLGEGQRFDGQDAFNVPGTLLALVLGLDLHQNVLQQLVIESVATVELFSLGGNVIQWYGILCFMVRYLQQQMVIEDVLDTRDVVFGDSLGQLKTA
jgi:hypothetical protein